MSRGLPVVVLDHVSEAVFAPHGASTANVEQYLAAMQSQNSRPSNRTVGGFPRDGDDSDLFVRTWLKAGHVVD